MKLPKTASDYFSSLENLMEDGGKTAFQEVREFAELRETEIKFPAVAALAAWADDGLTAINEIALEQKSSKSISAALKVHSAIATCNSLGIPAPYFYAAGEYFDKLNSRVEQLNLQSFARSCLRDLVVELPTNEILIPLGTAFTQMGMVGEEFTGELVRAISTKWLHFGPNALTSYQALIDGSPADEPQFQDFFERYPQLLDPMAIQVWSQPDFHGALEPDFVVRRADNSYLIVEIECPAKKIITRGNQLTAQATHAEKQTTEYRDFLLERMVETKLHFPGFHNPDCMAVVGLQSALTDQQSIALRRSNSARHKVQIVGFDWLLDRARSIQQNLSSQELEVVKRQRII